MIFKSLPALLAILSAYAFAKNPIVNSPGPMTYSAGQPMEVAWKDGDTGFVNIDIIQENPEVMQFPMMIASVPRDAGKYTFTLPSSLKSAGKYHVRVWGEEQPQMGSPAMSQAFTVINVAPQAVNTFTVTAPNKDQPCAAGKVCKISWDFPANNMYPAMVDISLFRVGNPYAIEHIGTVDSSLKSYSWVVPQDSALRSGNVYVSVSGQGQPVVGPSQSTDMGGNSQAFMVGEPSPMQEGSSDMKGQSQEGEKKDDKDSKKDEKKDEKKDNKKDKKMNPPKPSEPKKVSGAAAKDKNAASQISTSAGIMIGFAAAALMSVLF